MGQIRKLYVKYLQGNSSAEELAELMRHFEKYGEKSPLMALIENELLQEAPNTEDSEEVKEGLSKNYAVLQARLTTKDAKKTLPLWWISAAACLLIAIGAVWVAYFSSGENIKELSTAKKYYTHDLPAASNKAILTLENGKEISLNDSSEGVLAQNNGISIQKNKDGQVTFVLKGTDTNNERTKYNVISTPKGGKYDIVLSDGTKVYLNASSSLKFPNSFKGNERTVILTGEAFFEVSKNKKMPFIVNASSMKIKVLGTHFNVMAYEDEKNIQTTLVEGAVELKGGKGKAVLKPGEQGSFSNQDNRIDVAPVDVSIATAWKDGYFVFDNSNLQEVMRQLARWYDLKIVYDGHLPESEFNGRIKRSSSLKKVLRVLESNNVNFSLNGNTLTIKS
ncbi:MAG: FecR domain-containing protein [Sphingobacteriaceae bacterium]|nr:FecR domain-containing protein [Sphingobacteriaceae bacterium]